MPRPSRPQRVDQGTGATPQLKATQPRSPQGPRAQGVPSVLSLPLPSHPETGALRTSPLWEIFAWYLQ